MAPATAPNTILMSRAKFIPAGIFPDFPRRVWRGDPSETLKVPAVLLTRAWDGIKTWELLFSLLKQRLISWVRRCHKSFAGL
jgi:hypothetical protein